MEVVEVLVCPLNITFHNFPAGKPCSLKVIV